MPFDSFSIAGPAPVYILIAHYLLLATPFFFTGMAIGSLLSGYSERAGSIYALNLFGSRWVVSLRWWFPHGWVEKHGSAMQRAGWLSGARLRGSCA